MQTSFGVFRGKPQNVKIRFAAEVAGYISEKIWHKTQKIKPQKDGSLIFEARVAGTDEIKFWLMSWDPRPRLYHRQPCGTKSYRKWRLCYKIINRERGNFLDI
jgi:hypothetical protein